MLTLETVIRNLASGNRAQIRTTGTHTTDHDSNYETEDNEKPKGAEKYVGIYLQTMRNGGRESRLVEYVPSHVLLGVLDLHDRMSPRFSLGGCLRSLHQSYTRSYQMIQMRTHHVTPLNYKSIGIAFGAGVRCTEIEVLLM